LAAIPQKAAVAAVGPDFRVAPIANLRTAATWCEDYCLRIPEAQKPEFDWRSPADALVSDATVFEPLAIAEHYFQQRLASRLTPTKVKFDLHFDNAIRHCIVVWRRPYWIGVRYKYAP
jgi:hypothetical protein